MLPKPCHYLHQNNNAHVSCSLSYSRKCETHWTKKPSIDTMSTSDGHVLIEDVFENWHWLLCVCSEGPATYAVRIDVKSVVTHSFLTLIKAICNFCQINISIDSYLTAKPLFTSYISKSWLPNLFDGWCIFSNTGQCH